MKLIRSQSKSKSSTLGSHAVSASTDAKGAAEVSFNVTFDSKSLSEFKLWEVASETGVKATTYIFKTKIAEQGKGKSKEKDG